MQKNRFVLKTLTLALVLAMVAPFAGAFAQEGTIIDVLTAQGNFTTLLAALEAAGLAETLSGAGPYTLFAPTDDAFAALPEGTLDTLLANVPYLTDILTYHVVSGAVLAADAAALTSATTLQGQDVAIAVDEAGSVVLDGAAAVVTADLAAGNGVVHAIDAVILPVVELPEVDALSVTGSIISAGSSTVYPLSEAVAELFTDEGYSDSITIDSVGTGGGFERFCTTGETDIANASRAIKDEEVAACDAIGRSPIEFRVGTDAIAVVVSAENDFVQDLTLEQLAAIFSGAAATWADVNPEWPAEAIQRFSPGNDSGTFDYFIEIVFADLEADAREAALLNAPDTQFSEDDNVLVQGVEGSPYAIGYFGFAYYQAEAANLRAVSIEGVAPSFETAESGEYTFARPLYIYSDAAILADKPQVAAFINFYLTNVNDVIGNVGYFPASRLALNAARLAWLEATGTAYGGGM